jgi:hypothetical protein
MWGVDNRIGVIENNMKRLFNKRLLNHGQNLRISRRWRQQLAMGVLVVLLVLLSIIPIRIGITLSRVPNPTAMLVLGGSPDRMVFAAALAQTPAHQALPIWVSICPSTLRLDQRTFAQANVAPHRLRFDQRATDTLTNFTSLVDDLVQQQHWHLQLMTSDYHMARARAIATLVLGSRGIVVTPIAVPSQKPPETLWHIGRDCGRSLLWLVTGKTGAGLNPQLEHCLLTD